MNRSIILPNSPALRPRARPLIACLMLLLLGTLGLLGMAAQAPEPSLVISELLLDPAGASTTQAIEFFNAGSTPVSLNGAVLAVGDQTLPLSGLASVPPGGIVVVRWNQTGTSSGSQFFTGRRAELSPAQGSVALFKSNQVTSPGEMLAYVQWGAARQARAAVAEQAGLWDPAAFLPRAAEGQSLTLFPGGSGRALSDWTAAAPTVGAVNPATASGFQGWRLVGGRSSQAPSALFVSETNSLELASVAAGGIVEHRRYVGDAWSLIGNPGSALSPALASSPDGALELIGLGADRQIVHNRHVFDQWDSFTPVGAESALPAALAFNADDSATDLVIVAPDSQLQHSRFDGFQWSAFEPVGAASGAPPALVFNPQASSLDLLFSGSDRAVYHARFMNGAWSAPKNTGGQTLLRPALIVLPDGSLEAAIAGTDGAVRQNRFVNGAWQPTWQPIPGLRSDLPPTMVYNSRRQATELFAVGLDRQLRQARRTTSGWSLPAATGIITAHPPAVVIGAGNMVDLVATGQDGQLWHNRFQAPLDGPIVTLSRDVQPIFTSACATSGCHRGSFPEEGLNLAAGETHASTVGVPSGQADMNLVEPGDPDKSYLLHKLNGTQNRVGGSGTRMPRNRAPLTAAQITRVRQWIEQGAEDN